MSDGDDAAHEGTGAGSELAVMDGGSGAGAESGSTDDGPYVRKVHYQSSFRNDPGFQISIKTLVHLHLKTLVHLRISYISQMDSCDTNSTGIYVC